MLITVIPWKKAVKTRHYDKDIGVYGIGHSSWDDITTRNPHEVKRFFGNAYVIDAHTDDGATWIIPQDLAVEHRDFEMEDEYV